MRSVTFSDWCWRSSGVVVILASEREKRAVRTRRGGDRKEVEVESTRRIKSSALLFFSRDEAVAGRRGREKGTSVGKLHGKAGKEREEEAIKWERTEEGREGASTERTTAATKEGRG
jgi:hypothetical protein